MLPRNLKITTKDILYAEKILLPKGKYFDTERRDFIKNLDTIDLQAVPGSGKTTALLAKLLILERYMPFQDGSGVLVISHTNAAIDEIKEKIQRYCPKLFSYPNFVGTIQSFVDQFLAIPYYCNKIKKRPYRIDNEIYNEKILNVFEKTYGFRGFLQSESNEAKYFTRQKTILSSYRLRLIEKKVEIVDSINGNKLNIQNPRKTCSYSEQEKEKIKQWLIKIKSKVMSFGVLCFDDAYFLANLYIFKNPQILKLLQKRFPIVFVDEMQDMDKHQHDLLDVIFLKKYIKRHCFQRIGDKNQAIHNNSSYVPAASKWIDHGRPKNLRGSHRLTPENAELVKYFGLNDSNQIIGLNNEANIKPHIIIYDEPNEVLPKFTDLVSKYSLKEEKHPIMAIGWTTHKTEEDYESDKIRIQDYHAGFNKDSIKRKTDFKTLREYLLFHEDSKQLASIRKNILRAFVKITRLEGKLDENGRLYTINKLIEYLKFNFSKQYEELKLLVYECALGVLQGKESEIIGIFREFTTKFFKDTFGIESYTNPDTSTFIDTEPETYSPGEMEEESASNPNIHSSNGIDVEVGTVHSIKGRTLSSVVYFETFYQGHEAYESLRLSGQFKKVPFSDNPKSDKSHHIQSTKMAYVGFSRPTHLLCFAVHRSRFDSDLNNPSLGLIII